MAVENLIDVGHLDAVATDEVQDVRAQVDFNARRGSGLGLQLEDVSSANSRLAPILDDEAAATLHLAFRYSAEAAEMVNAFAAWSQLQTAMATNQDPLVMDAMSQIGETM